MSLPEMTLPEIRTAVRQRSDMVNSSFVSDDELSSYINQSLFGLYDLLVTTYGADYYATSADLPTAGTDTLTLPTDFYKLLGVDYLASAGRYISLKQFNFTERNRASANLTGSLYTNTRYRVRGGSLWLTPTPSSGQTIKVWYVPRLTPLVDPVFITVASVQTGDWIGIESYSTLIAGTSFAIGDNDAETAANIVVAARAGDYNTADASGFVLSVTSNVISITQEAVVNTSREWMTSNSTRLAISGGSPPTTVGFYTGRDAPTAAQASSDGISGWLEYVIVDAAIKCMQKEESDTRVLQAQRTGLIQRITSSAANRDAGSPSTVADVTQTGSWDDPFFNTY